MTNHKTKPLIVAVDMGYGHLRAARPLAEAVGTEILHADTPPLTDEREQKLWARARSLYEGLTRFSQMPIGAPLRSLVEQVTFIEPLHPIRDLSKPNVGARILKRFIAQGMGEGLAARMKMSNEPLITTFYAPAIAAEALGAENITCIVTDSDLNRIWVPHDSKKSKIIYCAPTARVQRRLLSYGIPAQNIRLTGFPLPHRLVGGTSLSSSKLSLRNRLSRLDKNRRFLGMHEGEISHFLGTIPEAKSIPHLVYAVGGAGAQGLLPRSFLPSLRRLIEKKELQMTLVAGIREGVRDTFLEALKATKTESLLNNGIEILYEPDRPKYFAAFEDLLERADALWTKPSELTFYAALGIPLIFSWPVGAHERYNRRWAVELGAGLKMRNPKNAGGWLEEWLEDGTLAHAAWAGFTAMPKFGLYKILQEAGVTSLHESSHAA